MSKIDKEFDERFPTFKGIGARHPIFEENVSPNHIKQFIHQKIKEITDEMIGEENEEYIPDDQEYALDEGEKIGYNKKRQEITTIANKYLK